MVDATPCTRHKQDAASIHPQHDRAAARGMPPVQMPLIDFSPMRPKPLPAEKILLAGNDAPIAEHRQSLRDPGTRPPAWRLHLRQRNIRNLPAEICRPGDHRASEHAQPVVVPRIHLGEIRGQFDECRNHQRRAAADSPAAVESSRVRFAMTVLNPSTPMIA